MSFSRYHIGRLRSVGILDVFCCLTEISRRSWEIVCWSLFLFLNRWWDVGQFEDRPLAFGFFNMFYLYIVVKIRNLFTEISGPVIWSDGIFIKL